MSLCNRARRNFLKSMGLGTLALTIPGCSSLRLSGAYAAKRPNIVLIMADDLGYECLGCYGSTSYKTPVLDDLARGGMRFEHCYSQPLCTPSRVQIMTGQYNFRNYRAFGIIDAGQISFGHVLKGAGYATCVAGKWQLYGSSIERRQSRGAGAYPEQMGFDEHCLWQIAERGSRYRDPVIVQNGKGPKDLVGAYGPDVFCDYVLDFIERNKLGPFLVYYPMALVHSPFVPTPDSPDWTNAQHRGNRRYFGDMVAYMDKVVGRIVVKLDQLGLRDNTLILFTGDNGTGRGIKSRTSGGVVTGGKGSTTDAGTHVPLIANWKGTTPAGTVCGDLVDFSDFLPTLAEAAHASLPENRVIDGRSFLPQLRGQKGRPREWIFCHYQRNPGDPLSRFARGKRWKLYHDGRMFDVQADPLEKHPIEPGPSDSDGMAARRRLQAVLDSMK